MYVVCIITLYTHIYILIVFIKFKFCFGVIFSFINMALKPLLKYQVETPCFYCWCPLAHLLTEITVYPKKYAHGFCFTVLCCGYTLSDFPISINLTSLALWQSNDCPSASKATLMNMDKYFMWIHYEYLHNHNKAKHNKTVCIFLGIYCNSTSIGIRSWVSNYIHVKQWDVIIHTCPNFNYTAIGVEVWMNNYKASKLWMHSLIHALIPAS